MSAARRAGSIAGILVLDLPVTFVLTTMLMPVWSAVEARTGIESVGHSGPATWCYAAVYACVALLTVATYLRRAGRLQPGEEQGP